MLHTLQVHNSAACTRVVGVREAVTPGRHSCGHVARTFRARAHRCYDLPHSAGVPSHMAGWHSVMTAAKLPTVTTC